MSLKRGTRVLYIGHEDHDHIDWNLKLYEKEYNLKLSAIGRACDGYKGGWVRINWTNPNGDTVGILPMRSVQIKVLVDSADRKELPVVARAASDAYSGTETEVKERLADEMATRAPAAMIAEIREKVHVNTKMLVDVNGWVSETDEGLRNVFTLVGRLQEENVNLKKQLNDFHYRLQRVECLL